MNSSCVWRTTLAAHPTPDLGIPATPLLQYLNLLLSCTSNHQPVVLYGLCSCLYCVSVVNVVFFLYEVLRCNFVVISNHTLLLQHIYIHTKQVAPIYSCINGVSVFLLSV